MFSARTSIKSYTVNNMSQKWNLQDIRPVEPRKKRPSLPTSRLTDSSAEEEGGTLEPNYQRPVNDAPNIIIQDGTKKGNRSVLYAVGAFIAIVGGAILLSSVFGKTELTIYPENREPTINSDLTAYPDKRADNLSYEILTLEATSERQVKASGQVQVQEQATGMIEIIKTTSGAERLIKNTRFRTPEGLVFRIQESVVVPGAVVDNSGGSVPGTIQAKVFADEVGESYNVAAGTKFDIPGFEESGLTDLYNAIYAQSSSPFTGGFNGPQFQIEDAELQTARQELQLELRNQLLERVANEKPAGFITFSGATSITYNQLPAVEYGGDLVTIKEQAVLQIPLFKATDFGAFLAKEAVATYNGGPVRIKDPSVLTFSYKTATTSSSVLANETALDFNLTGKPLLIWEYDIEKLKKDLAGLPKTAVNNAISAYPGIEGARVSITPFWKRTFPVDSEDIKVTEELRDK